MEEGRLIRLATAPKSGCTAGSCGGTGDQLSHLPEDIRRRVHDHPCYSEQAHHYYARMHAAVAPACNIQCHYCNRKYDCANESRPGVVSELLTPDQAVKKTLAVATAIPQMTVLGIAGPGDPLANPERTFATFRMLSEQAPDIKLCLSTNGLAVADFIDEIVKYNIDHVTITINCVDPDVGVKIYPWIFWNQHRVKGLKGVRILIERQQKGLEMLIERGILVKVNSVMIPGVNSDHLKEVSRVVKGKGAFLHNVMPLIARAEHGDFYGAMGQRPPSRMELAALQDACAGDMNMMRHCRQCRADAVGLLGDDRGAEFTLDKIATMAVDYPAAMEKRARVQAAIAEKQAAVTPPEASSIQAEYRPVLMAVATSGGGVINRHFGHAKEFLVYEVSSGGVRLIGPRRNERYCFGPDTCGDEPDVLAGTIRILSGCEAVLCAKIGYGPWRRLEEAGIQPYGEYVGDRIIDAVMAVYRQMIDNGDLDDDAAIPAAGVKASA